MKRAYVRKVARALNISVTSKVIEIRYTGGSIEKISRVL